MMQFPGVLAVAALMLGLTLGRSVEASDPVLQRESKLERRVTLQTRRIHLGALLERVGEECGVKLEAEDRHGPISGYELAVKAEGQPARDLLEAVTRLYSFPPDRWVWSRSRMGTLRLQPSLKQDALTAVRTKFVEDTLVAELGQRRNFYALDPNERARRSAQNPYLKAIDNPRTEGFTSFLQAIGEGELRGVIRGGAITLPFERLDASQREFIQREFAVANEPFSPPQTVRIYSRMLPGASVVLLHLGDLGAHGVLGGAALAQNLDQAVTNQWLKSDEATSVPAELLSGKKGAPSAEVSLQDASLDGIVSRLGGLSRLNLLLDRSSTRKVSADLPLSGSLSEVLAQLSERRILKWKRWNEYVLFRPADWLALSREEAVAWPQIKELQASARGNNGYLQGQDWLGLSLLSQSQLGHLARGEFPDAEKVAQHQPLLRIIQGMTDGERAAAARPEGGSWADWTEDTKKRLQAVLTDADARETRLYAAWVQRPAGPVAVLFLGKGAVRPVEIPLQRARQWSDAQGRFVDLPAASSPGR